VEVLEDTLVEVHQEVQEPVVVKEEQDKPVFNQLNQEIQVLLDLAITVLDVHRVECNRTEVVEVLERLLHILVPLELMVNLVELENQ
jgi:hypothetical protein